MLGVLQLHLWVGRLAAVVVVVLALAAISGVWAGASLLTIANTILLLAVLIGVDRLSRTSLLTARVSALVGDRELHAAIGQILDAGTQARSIADPIHRELILRQLASAAARFEDSVAGRVLFMSTEHWRGVYEELLTSRGLHLYRSVARVRDVAYWQTEAGLNSMQLNLRLTASGQLGIERIVILTDELWPDKNQLPVQQIQQWIHEQHQHEICLWLVRESELNSEPDLMTDIGIYGSRAVGTQEPGEDGRTRRFTLQFGIEHVQAAEERWRRLLVHAVKYSDFLDRYSVSE